MDNEQEQGAPMGETSDKASAIVTVLDALTFKKIVLGAVAGLLVILGYSGWEARAAVAVAVVSSPALMTALGAGVVLFLIGAIVHGLIKRIDEMNMKRVDELSTRLKEVEDELIECKVACKAEAVATHAAIKEALDRIESKLEK